MPKKAVKKVKETPAKSLRLDREYVELLAKRLLKPGQIYDPFAEGIEAALKRKPPVIKPNGERLLEAYEAGRFITEDHNVASRLAERGLVCQKFGHLRNGEPELSIFEISVEEAEKILL